jgi:hypothetical protein
MNSNIDIFDKLGEASSKVEKHQKQASDEYVRREKAEKEQVLFRRKVKPSPYYHGNYVKSDTKF